MRYTSFRFSISLATLAFALVPSVSHADVSLIGDTIPAPGVISDAGGPVGGDLIVGDSTVDTDIFDEGGLFMDNALPLFDPLTSLECTDFIIGNQEQTVGAATIEDLIVDDATGFAIPSVIVNNDFIVGNAGQGGLDLFDSASVVVTNLTTVGSLQTGLGDVTINGQGSRIITEDLIVADLGIGSITIDTRASLVSTTGYIGNGDASIGYVSVSDLGTRWSVGSVDPDTDGRLVIGNLVATGDIGEVDGDSQFGEGQGTLRIANRGIVQVSDEVIIGPNGLVQLETQGRLRILPTSEAISGTSTDVVDVITNQGDIAGNGYIDFAGVVDGPTDAQSSRALTFLNTGTGLITNDGNAVDPLGGGTNQREKLVFTGNADNGDVLANFGTIFSDGGEMEFNVPVENSMEIVARDAIMTFPFSVLPPGLTNNPGSVFVVGGDSTIHGSITPLPLSNFTILGDSIVTIVGDLLFTEPFLSTDGDGEVAASGAESATLSIAIGEHPGYLTVTGNLDLSNAELALDIAGMEAPNIGDIVNLITVEGDVTGTFVNDSVVVGGQRWDVDYSAGSIFATYAGLANVPGDFDGDGDVDGRDFLAWQRNPGIGDLAEWQANYGGNGSLSAGLASVPEPSALVLSVLAVAITNVFNRRKQS